MEIQKIFSNVENPEETLYSVLMTEDEVALFSEMEEEEEKKGMSRKTKAALGTGVGVAATGASVYGANKLGQKLSARGQQIMDNAGSKVGSDYAKDLVRGERVQKIGEKLQKPASFITGGVKGAKDKVAHNAEVWKRARKIAKKAAKR